MVRLKKVVFLGVCGLIAMATGCGDSSESPDSTGALTDGPTYWQDVEPIFAGKCIMCHQEGGVAPFKFDTYENVAAMRDAISVSVTSKSMPPWLADNSCGPKYVGDWTLSESQIETIAAWASKGAPEGDIEVRTEAVATADSWTEMSRVDLEVEMPVAYMPTSAPDDYRCFVVPWPETETTHVTGFVTEPGNQAIVHHVITYVVPPGKVAAALAAEEADDGPGYSCFGPARFGQEYLPWLSAWAPGGSGGDFPANTGIRVEPGSALILQAHYNVVMSDPAPDKSKMIFQIETDLPRIAALTPFTNYDWVAGGTMILPAGEVTTHSVTLPFAEWVHAYSGGMLRQNETLTIHDVNFHMHQLGVSGSLEIIRASGEEECLLGINDWDFNWQLAYRLKEPVVFNPGDRLRLTCTWDNTAANQSTAEPPRDLGWGDGTYDEMCLAVMYLSQDGI